MNKKILSLGSLALVLSIFGFYTSAYAYKGDPNVKGPNYSEERHEAMQEALANRDYNTWANLMQDRGRVKDVVNEANFAKFAEAHDLAQQGKLEEAKAIRQEIGLGLRNGDGCMNRVNK